MKGETWELEGENSENLRRSLNFLNLIFSNK